MGLEQKGAAAVDRFQNTTRHGTGCGCVATGCGIVLVVLMLMCVGSYYVTMHSSLPLSMIERALEADGEAEIEGLRGSISSGIEIDLLRFRSDLEGYDNEFRNVKFSYNGFWNFISSQRLIISEASVGEATIYAELGTEDDVGMKHEIDGEEVSNEVNEELKELRDEFETEDSEELKELRIDLMQAHNIQLIDPLTDTRLKFEAIEFRNFRMERGRVVNLGDLRVRSDQLDVETKPSSRFADDELAWNLVGTVKPRLHQSVEKEIPFDVDLALRQDPKEPTETEFHFFFSLLDGQVEIDEPFRDSKVIKLDGFTPAEYLVMDRPLSPSDWHVQLKIEKTGTQLIGEGDQKTEYPIFEINLEPRGAFQLGDTSFQIQTKAVRWGPPEAVPPEPLIATGQLGNQEIIAQLTLDRSPPWYSIKLQAEDREPQDLWAQLFFDRDYRALAPEERSQVDATIRGDGEAVAKDSAEDSTKDSGEDSGEESGRESGEEGGSPGI